MSYNHLQTSISEIVSHTEKTTQEKLTAICELLQTSMSYYNWIGFYFANEAEKMLHLEAFAGEATDHTSIPFGKGICGQVAESNENFIVPDVKAQDNYIACSIHVKAEIVVPLFKDGKNIGQIDVDSHTANPFTSEDEQFLEWINEQVAQIV